MNEATRPDAESSAAELRGRRVAVAMSGGIDSSVVAALARDAGAEVVGVHLHLFPGARADAAARDVARRLGIEFHVLDLETEFERRVVGPFVEAYLAGRTPNPCVLCNPRIKLGLLLDRARADWGAECVATGHYARIERNPQTGRMELRAAADATKDQTYYLTGLSQDQLGATVTPLAGWPKSRVRDEAHRLGLDAVAQASESNDICFVPDGDYAAWVARHVGLDEDATAGPIVNTRGETLGRHRGLHRYTIGQRRGLGVAAPHPLYVVALRPDTQTVVVGGPDDLLSRAVTVEAFNWVSRAPQREAFRARVKIRYRTDGEAATVEPAPDGASVRIVFDRPVRAAAPGQNAAVYDADDPGRVDGGGRIANAE